ncbi:hypothetical protein F1880_004239 [Penicillium rolfsii]|nr:hypothetical protein F1880_004239 [Penicillium rolfsii]
MAEIVGTIASALTLAGLFKLCIESFDVIHTLQTQGTDLQKLSLKLRIEKCRLYTWGQAMGLTAETTTKQRPIDLCTYSDLIHETMTLILAIFDDSEKMQDRYGCAGVKASQLGLEGPESVIQQLSASFNNFAVKSTPADRAKSSLRRKTHWVIRDRKKFETLICDAKAYIDSLQEITKNLQVHTSQHQQDMMTSGIRRINNTRALEWLSEVCEIDYPELSDAATSKAETITQLSIAGNDLLVQGTNSENDDDSDAFSVITSLEDMTVTELKYELSTFRLRAKRRAKEATSQGQKSQDGPEELPDDNQPGAKWNSVTTAVQKSSQPDDEPKSSPVTDATKASVDKEFYEEMLAVTQWFKVLSHAEKACSLLWVERSHEEDLDFEQYTVLEGNNSGLIESPTGQSEEDASDEHMADMMRAIECEEFRHEAKAILSWFRVLSHPERAMTLIRLRENFVIDSCRTTLSTSQKQRWFEHWSMFDTTPLDLKGWLAKKGEQESTENPDQFMEAMIQTSQLEKFRDETDAVMTWFMVLLPSERAVALLRLREYLSTDFDRMILSLDPMHQDQDEKHRILSQESAGTHQQLASKFKPTPWNEFETRLREDYSPQFTKHDKATNHELQGARFGKAKSRKEEFSELRQFSEQFQLLVKERPD